MTTSAPHSAPDSPDSLAARIRRKLVRQHFMHHIGADLTRIEPGRVEAELVLDRQHQQHTGFAHGGLVATMADLVAGFAAVTLVPEGTGVVTVELKTSYLHPGVGQRLRAVGWVLKAGRRLHFCESEVWCDDLLIAKATATMAVLEPATPTVPG
ncbi:PaaI family thioesterase [Hymenobacter sp. NST-14]|uniref:PaaI family thioesterase n=1 Tax=Hymenobacter piscis TaxID=2839984 RepID=UPI001C00EFAC|nr:PaaI family thioesterase [Hymenobacter piscis]MBT9393756.1 PaaI family thioesterase [Hymenobacter piscis]